MTNTFALKSTLAIAGLLAVLPVWAAPADAPAPVRGRVTVVDTTAKTITLEDRRTQATTVLHVNEATKYLIDGPGAIADLKVGQTIRVMGQTDASTVTARGIQVIPTEEASLPLQVRPGGYAPTQGVIATLTPALTITTADKKTDTIQADATTRITTGHAATLADIKLQANVTALTTGTGDAAVATFVHVQAPRFRRGGTPPPVPVAPVVPVAPAQ